MGKWFGAVASAVVLAAVAAGSGIAGAADHKMGDAPCSPAGTSLALTAENHAFDKDCLAVRAGEAFTIRFENRDADRHNVAILPSHTSTETIFQGDIVPGPKNTVYAVPNMKAGTYHFHCEIHPNLMQGTFVVAAAATGTTGAKPSATPSPTMSMGADTPAAAPTPAPRPDAAPPRAGATAPKAPAAPSQEAGDSVSAPKAPAAVPKAAAATGNNLPHTGPASSRLLLLLAGLALAAGGLSVLGSARPVPSKG